MKEANGFVLRQVVRPENMSKIVHEHAQHALSSMPDNVDAFICLTKTDKNDVTMSGAGEPADHIILCGEGLITALGTSLECDDDKAKMEIIRMMIQSMVGAIVDTIGG